MCEDRISRLFHDIGGIFQERHHIRRIYKNDDGKYKSYRDRGYAFLINHKPASINGCAERLASYSEEILASKEANEEMYWDSKEKCLVIKGDNYIFKFVFEWIKNGPARVGYIKDGKAVIDEMNRKSCYGFHKRIVDSNKMFDRKLVEIYPGIADRYAAICLQKTEPFRILNN